MKKAFLTVFYLFTFLSCYGQRLLEKKITIHVIQKPLTEVLSLISQKGGFYFSYGSELVQPNRPITLTAEDKTIKQVLDILFEGNCLYKEKDKYIILQPGRERSYTVSGYIRDGKTGAQVSNATVYETQLLASTLTNEQGYFKIQLRHKDQHQAASLRVSKEKYNDMSMDISGNYDQEVSISIMPNMDMTLQDVVVTSQPKVENTWLGNFLLSSKQKIQSMNLRNFFAERPIQSSLIPCIGTHGRLGSQVVNQFSFNVLGGYTGGSDGVEIGGLFNIDKQNVQYVQVAGLFNIVGGNMRGSQVAGIYNNVLDSVTGSQVAGIVNITKGNIEGVQVSGIFNRVDRGITGVQVAGIINHNKDIMDGVQVAGIASINEKEVDGVQVSGIISYAPRVRSAQVSGLASICRGEMQGVQAAGIINYAKKMKGVQFGLINIADSFSGCGIGIVNVYKNGYHKLSVSSSDVQHINIAYKGGTRQLYGILAFGFNANEHNKAYSGSYGFGREWPINKKISLNTEIISQVFYLGSWRHSPVLGRFQPALNIALSKQLSVCFGPVLSFSFLHKVNTTDGFMTSIPGKGYHLYTISDEVTAWIGWQIGFHIF